MLHFTQHFHLIKSSFLISPDLAFCPRRPGLHLTTDLVHTYVSLLEVGQTYLTKSTTAGGQCGPDVPASADL